MEDKEYHELMKKLLRLLNNTGTNVTINDEVYLSTQEAISSIIEDIDKCLAEGDINGKIIDLERYQRWVEANEIGFALFRNPKTIDIEYSPNNSFVSTMITCENFGFECGGTLLHIKNNDKALYEKFISLIDFLDTSSGANPTDINVTFTVNDVWKER